MRFDDSITTVLAAEMATSLGAQSMWRQLVDLAGQGRVPVTEGLLYRLRALRTQVPQAVRAASARALAATTPPAPLVALFAEDAPAVAAPVLRHASLGADAWIALLPFLAPAGRGVLRHRRDLPAPVRQALGVYGSVDFVLSSSAPVDAASQPAVPAPGAGDALRRDPLDRDDDGFVPLARVAMGLPVVANAFRAQAAARAPSPPTMPTAPDSPLHGPFEIADIVARIDAFQRQREEAGPADGGPVDGGPVDAGNASIDAEAQGFRFETDMTGTIRWVSGIAREAVIGVSISGAAGAGPGAAQVDGAASGAFRRRARMSDARLVLEGSVAAAGAWRLSAVPVFDPASGRFMGYCGQARRPRPDEQAEPVRRPLPLAADSLRQLVHELRTPATAIVGFAEMIDAQVLGPVPGVYRDYAGTIGAQSRALLGAIDDIDTAARIEAGALELRPMTVPMQPLLQRVAADLAALVTVRGSALAVAVATSDIAAHGDDRATERLVGRLVGAVVAASTRGDVVLVSVGGEGEGGELVVLRISRPAALLGLSSDALFAIDADGDDAPPGVPLLGTGFALRLARNLAAELGGSLSFESQCLTLRLPAAFTLAVDQASTS